MKLLLSILVAFLTFPLSTSDDTTDNAAIDEAMVERAKTVGKLNKISKTTKNLASQMDEFENSRTLFSQNMKDLEEILTNLNLLQMHRLRDKLKEIETKEMARRNALAESGITPEELDELLSPPNVLRESDAKILTWVKKVMDDEANDLLAYLANPVGGLTYGGACVSPQVAVNEVQQAIVNYSRDGIGLYDHAQAGAIVHELTSATYRPPGDPDPNGSIDTAWWTRFVPADWEWLLPSSWKQWGSITPSYLAHTLGYKIVGNVAPPEAILHGSTMPGTCWPMSGSAGRVTIRLLYPVKATAFSIDHAPVQLLADMTQHLKSAPKRLNVYGYAPCGKGGCEGLGFDPSSKMLIASLLYDVTIGGVQTFTVDDSAGGGGCSSQSQNEVAVDEFAGSCTAPPPETVIAAIEVNMLENWGNEGYTCLYRFRVHGEPRRLS